MSPGVVAPHKQGSTAKKKEIQNSQFTGRIVRQRANN